MQACHLKGKFNTYDTSHVACPWWVQGCCWFCWKSNVILRSAGVKMWQSLTCFYHLKNVGQRIWDARLGKSFLIVILTCFDDVCNKSNSAQILGSFNNSFQRSNYLEGWCLISIIWQVPSGRGHGPGLPVGNIGEENQMLKSHQDRSRS